MLCTTIIFHFTREAQISNLLAFGILLHSLESATVFSTMTSGVDKITYNVQ
jgi:hypothetical protein